MSNRFADEFWEEFERLTLEIVQKYYDIYDNKIVRSTPVRKDGGYDGIIIINNIADGIWEKYKILIEAKLRENSNKDIPLAGFSKVFIIAVNMFADEVYVSTNLHYSKKTQENVKKFSEQTGLQVKLIDIFTIKKMLEEHPDISQQFDNNFIHKLLIAVSLHPLDRHIEIADNYFTLNSLPDMIGDTRNKILKGRLESIKKNHGLMIIHGERGCGKTLFLKHLLYHSFFAHIPSHILSLKDFLTTKEFFVNLLAAIWNISVLDIYALTKEDIENITCYISEETISKRAKVVLHKILIEDIHEYDGRIDIWHDQLIQYLFEIYSPILKRKKQILSFTDVHNSDFVILDFLNKFIRKFYNSNLVIIIEARTIDFNLNWNSYLKKLDTLVDKIPSVYLSRLSLPECETYIHKKAPKYNRLEISSIASVCLPIPLYIDNILQIISCNAEFERLFKSSDLNIKALYENDNFKEQLISHSFSLYICQTCREAKFIACIISLLDGCILIENLYSLSEINIEIGLKELINSIYFVEENGVLKIQHLLYFDAISRCDYLTTYDLTYILKLTLNNIEKLISDSFSIKIKTLQIAIKLKRKDLIESDWKEIIHTLLNNNEFKLANSLLTDIHSIIYNNLSFLDKSILLIYLIKVYIGQNEYNSEILKNYISNCEDIFTYIKLNETSIFYKNEFLYLKSKYLLANGKYKEILSISKEYEFPEIIYMKALAIKHIYGIDECLKILKSGIKLFPQSWILKYSYYDHKAADLGAYHFKKSLKYLNNILPLWENLDLEQQIHYEYNKITLQFYLQESNIEEKCTKLCNHAFQNGILIEEGRCHNLLGQIEWVNNHFDEAYIEFKVAYDLQFQSYHATNIWIALANLSLLAFECSNKEKSIGFAEESIKYLLKYNYKLILLCPSVDELIYSKHKLKKPYIALLLLARNLYLVEKNSPLLYKYIENIPSKNLQNDLRKYAYTDKMKDVLFGTHFYFKGHFMIRS